MDTTAARLHLIRHGQTVWNAEGRWQGQAPHAPGLNDEGREQARRAAEHLAAMRVDAIYSSDLRRARETACIVAAPHGLPVATDPRLREVNLGDWEGLLFSEVESRASESLRERRRNPVHHRPPNGETLLELAGRVWSALEHIARAHPGGAALVVSHGLAIATIECHLRREPLSLAFARIPDNAEVLEVLIGGGDAHADWLRGQ